MRRVRLDEADLRIYLGEALGREGYIAEGHEVLGFEYKTRRIKRGGDYYKDGVEDGEYPPEGVEEIRWIKVLIGPPKGRKRQEREDDDVAVQDEAGERAGEHADGAAGPGDGGSASVIRPADPPAGSPR